MRIFWIVVGMYFLFTLFVAFALVSRNAMKEEKVRQIAVGENNFQIPEVKGELNINKKDSSTIELRKCFDEAPPACNFVSTCGVDLQGKASCNAQPQEVFACLLTLKERAQDVKSVTFVR